MYAPSGVINNALLTATMLLYGGSFVAMKAALTVFDPWLITLARMLLALAACSLFLKTIPPTALIKKHWPKILAMGLCEPCLYFLFEAKALTLTQASQAGMITALLPVLVACCAALTLGEKTSARSWSGLALGLAGAGVLSANAVEEAYSPDPMLGNLLEFMAMACAAVYTLLVRHLVQFFPAMFLTTAQVLIGAIFFSPALLISPWPESFTWPAVASVLFLGLGVSVGAYGLYNFCLSRLPASRVAAAVNLIPAFTVALGWACLGETIQGWQWLGIALIGAGTALNAQGT